MLRTTTITWDEFYNELSGRGSDNIYITMMEPDSRAMINYSFELDFMEDKQWCLEFCYDGETMVRIPRINDIVRHQMRMVSYELNYPYMRISIYVDDPNP